MDRLISDFGQYFPVLQQAVGLVVYPATFLVFFDFFTFFVLFGCLSHLVVKLCFKLSYPRISLCDLAGGCITPQLPRNFTT